VAAARPWIAVTAAAVLLLGGSGLGGCGAASGGDTPGPATTTAVSPRFNAADVAFVRALIPQQQQGVRIAEIGVRRAARPETRMLASAIVATQRDEATRLEGWLITWNQPAAPAVPADRHIAALGTMPAADFDDAFLGLLIARQDAAVKLARTEAGAGANPNALAFARQVDESRTAEIAQMRGYLK
jgi:uncharacterized protein (DUF305 family)